MRIPLEGRSSVIHLEGQFGDWLFLSCSSKGICAMSSAFPEYWPRDLPGNFLLQVLLVDRKGVPIPNKLIFISSKEAHYLHNATTNEQGLVQFSINTTSILANKFYITVSMQK